jgi:hypothetical protein
MKNFVTEMVDAFDQAIKLYKSTQYDKFLRKNIEVWVAFIVDDDERNVIDQKTIEVQLQLTRGIKSMRVTFDDVTKEGSLDENNVLTIRGKEIGFVYYRTGYQVEQYKTESDWKARIDLELSQAVKCPSIDFHLTTFKKFQQSFCEHSVIEEIMGDQLTSENKETLKQCFDGIWSLEDYDTNTTVQEIV